MAIVKYGIIGAGSIARHRHVPEAAANPKSKVVAIADSFPGRAEEMATQYGAAAYTDYQRMLKEADLDAVVVCGPNVLHTKMSIDALKAGFHVLCEKPMATTRADGKKMIAVAQQVKKYLMIGMNQRLMPAHAKAREILDTGKLGRVLAFETSFKHPGPDGWSVDGANSWFFKKAAAAMGVCGDLGVHKADLMRFLLGEEIIKVGGFVETLNKKYPNGKPIDVDDNAFLTAQTASGAVGTINISWTHYGNLEDNGTVLFCQKGVMRIAMDKEWGVMVDYRTGQKERYAVGAMATNTKQVASGVIDSFTDCILKKQAPSIDGVEGYRAMNIVLTAMEAAKAGKMKKVTLEV
jgi:predicted dehydrogenase